MCDMPKAFERSPSADRIDIALDVDRSKFRFVSFQKPSLQTNQQTEGLSFSLKKIAVQAACS